MPHRFFIPPDWLTPPTIGLHGETARQIKTVLRLKPGDDIIVLDNSGMEWRVTLTEVSKSCVQGRVESQQPTKSEPTLQLTLFQGTLKAQKFEWVLQKGTELGVSRFVPTVCQRSVANSLGALAKKYDRWQRIIREAAEQSQRGKLPRLEPALPLNEAVEQAKSHELVVMPWEEASGSSLKTILSSKRIGSIAVFIGPEGGLTPTEAALAQNAGVQLIKLGPRILRAETAGLAVCSAILYEIGDWEMTLT